MNKKEAKKEKDSIDDEVEKQLDSTWENWESRRRCEQTHVPEYKKRKTNRGSL